MRKIFIILFIFILLMGSMSPLTHADTRLDAAKKKSAELQTKLQEAETKYKDAEKRLDDKPANQSKFEKASKAYEEAKKTKSEADASVKNLEILEATKNFYTGPYHDPNKSYTLKALTEDILPKVATWIAQFLAAIAVLLLMWAGVLYLTAGGEEEKMTQATKTIMYVMAGMVLVMLGYAIVYLLLSIFSPG